jgi:dipeptidyl aminopeptidase/acylaminoacyl peptidase
VGAPGGAPLRLGREVGEHRWAAAAPRLAWLEQYDPRGRAGVLGVGGPGAATRTFGRNVTDFDLSPDGARVAFLRHTVDGGYSVDLWAGEVAGEPRKVARGVFGFSFSPDGRWLYYRTRCTRNGDACDLERLGMEGAPAGPEAIAEGVKSFEFDPRDPGRLLLTWQRADLVALDLGLWRAGKVTPVDRGALPGSIRLLGPDSRRVAYGVVQPKRAGVYVAAVPAGP